MAFGHIGKKVRLVPLDFERHYENAYQWINDTEVNAWLAVGDLPISRLAEKEWFETHQKGGQSEIMFAVETLDGVHIGFTSLFRINYQHGTAESGSIIGAKEYWGQGMGSDQARVRSRYAFETLGLRRVNSNYFEPNVRSARMQAAAGYEIWGVEPEALWKRGAYRNLVHTSLTRERWLALQQLESEVV